MVTITGGPKGRNQERERARLAMAQKRIDQRVKETAEWLKTLGIHRLGDLRRGRQRVLDATQPKFQRQDAAGTLFHVASELESIKSRVALDTYPAMKARDLIPADPDPPEMWAETSSYVRVGLTGLAQMVSDYSKDAPQADVESTKHSLGIETYAASMGWSIEELGKAMMTGRPLKDWKAQAAFRACEERIDVVAATGDTQRNTTGVLNDANVGTGSTTTGTDWTTNNASQQLDDMNEIVEATNTQTNDAATADTLVLPTVEFMEGSQKNMPGINENVLSYFLRTNPFIQDVDRWIRLNGAGSGGANRMWAYRRSDEVCYLTLAMDITMLDEQQRFLAYVVPVICRIGGAVVQKPLEMEYRDFPT